jgi:imidazolonepropionase-like amidohydrolase
MMADSTRQASAVLIRGARVFDGTGAAPVRADVFIEDEWIVSVGGSMAAPEGVAIIEAAGKFLMPGMLDSHVHATLFGEDGLQTYARMGVTTVKDLGGAFEQTIALRDRSRAGQVPGARVLAVGAFVEGDPPSWGAASGAFSGMETHTGDEEIEKTILRNMAAGVDGIKLYAGLPPPLLRHAIDMVARRVPVTGHLTATTATEAVAAGIDGLEHLQLTLYRDLVPDEHALRAGEIMGNLVYWGKVRRGWESIAPRGDAAQRLLAAMTERGTRMIPTLVLGGGIKMDFSPEEDAAFTPAQRERIAAAPARPRPAPEELQRSDGNMIGVVDEMHRAGVAVLPGTDCGAVPVPPGYGYHRELALLAKAMPNAAVLAAATSGAAAWLRRDDLGVIAPGKRADLVLIDGDPLRDIGDTRKIEAVLMDGVRVR